MNQHIEEAVELLIAQFGAQRLPRFTDEDDHEIAHVSIPVLAALGSADETGRPVRIERTHGADVDELGVMLADLGDAVRVSVHRIGASALDAERFAAITDAVEDVSTLFHGPNGLMSAAEVPAERLAPVLAPWVAAEVAAQAHMATAEVRR